MSFLSVSSSLLMKVLDDAGHGANGCCQCLFLTPQINNYCGNLLFQLNIVCFQKPNENVIYSVVGEENIQVKTEVKLKVLKTLSTGIFHRHQSRVQQARRSSWSSPTPASTGSRSCSTWASCSTRTPTWPTRWDGAEEKQNQPFQPVIFKLQ